MLHHLAQGEGGHFPGVKTAVFLDVSLELFWALAVMLQRLLICLVAAEERVKRSPLWKFRITSAFAVVMRTMENTHCVLMTGANKNTAERRRKEGLDLLIFAVGLSDKRKRWLTVKLGT